MVDPPPGPPKAKETSERKVDPANQATIDVDEEANGDLGNTDELVGGEVKWSNDKKVEAFDKGLFGVMKCNSVLGASGKFPAKCKCDSEEQTAFCGDKDGAVSVGEREFDMESIKQCPSRPYCAPTQLAQFQAAYVPLKLNDRALVETIDEDHGLFRITKAHLLADQQKDSAYTVTGGAMQNGNVVPDTEPLGDMPWETIVHGEAVPGGYIRIPFVSKAAEGHYTKEELKKGHIAKMKTIENGEAFAAVVGKSWGKWKLLVPGEAEEKAAVKKPTDKLFGGMPPIRDQDAIMEQRGVLNHNMGHIVQVVAAGVDRNVESGKFEEKVIVRDLVNQKILIGDREDFVTEKEFEERQQQLRANVAEKIKSAEGFKFHGNGGKPNVGHSQLLSKEEWADWITQARKSDELQARINEEAGNHIQKIEDAERKVIEREANVENLASGVEESANEYGKTLAQKAKQFSQLEYKFHTVPLETAQDAERKEDTRTADLDRIDKESRVHDKVVKDYNKFVEHLLENSKEFKDSMKKAYEAHFSDMEEDKKKAIYNSLDKELAIKAERDTRPVQEDSDLPAPLGSDESWEAKEKRFPKTEVNPYYYLPTTIGARTVMQDEGGGKWLVTNKAAGARLPHAGLAFRKTPENTALWKSGDAYVPWEKSISNGVLEGDGWVRFDKAAVGKAAEFRKGSGHSMDSLE